MTDSAHTLDGATALVTGAPGFIGQRLVADLGAQGARVVSLALETGTQPGVDSAFVGDLTDAAFVRDAVLEIQPDVIFHLAAVKTRSAEVSAFRGAIEVNLLGSLNVLEASVALHALQSIVLVGTAEEYGAAPVPYREGERELPISAYSYSKLAMTILAESLHRLSGLPTVVVRPTVAYGPGQTPDMFVSALVEALVAGREFPMTPGEQTRDFIYVDDLAAALVAAACSEGAVGHVINIGSGVETGIRDMALLVERLVGASNLVRLGATPYRAAEQMAYVADVSLARDLLGWEAATPLSEGLRRTIDAARALA